MSGGRRSHHVSRIGASVVTPDFQATWPKVEPVLRASFRRWGIDTDAVADLTQDVAERAWRHGVHFVDSGDLLRWCRVVARNLIVDRYRRSGREVLAAVDAGSSASAEDVVVSRLEVERLIAAFSRLPASEQQAIVGRTAMPATSAERVRRHRARERFARAIAAASAVAGWLGILGRRSRAAVAAVAVMPSLIVVIALTGAIPFGHTSLDSDRPAVEARPAPRAMASLSGAATTSVAPKVSPRHRERAHAPLPQRRVDVPLPTGQPQSVWTYHDPVDQPTICLYDQPVVGTICTPL